MRELTVWILTGILAGGVLMNCSRNEIESTSTEEKNMNQEENADEETFPVEKSEEEWRQELTEDEYSILREQGTEPSGSGDLLGITEEGVYTCAGCGNKLFESDEKFKSGTGWPSFWDVASDDAVKERPDHSLWRTRTEVICARCGGHLGHVFEDGPDPTGLRYCINSLALDFESEGDLREE